MRTWLKDLREESGMTQEQVAEQAKLSRPAYTMIENGNRNPSVPVAKRLGAALKVEWTYFFDTDGNESTPKKITT
ncbi:helix-turn-helix transcriptional regulator [Lacticaseibacillus zhaodongensis]|uniref:helix-turn-helix transcriptional regulator n=1 Tax=Lacticaseibacillus zhaodongensis TaxID=2668065 RepID=UPI0012D3633A|nr:helix-turn-helix transcriptional regulator [Lacticaseibacillus zhaodongensis]